VKYLLRVFDTGGLVQTIRIDGDSSAGATAVAQSPGLRMISVQADAAHKRRGVSWSALPGLKFNVELFARELAALLDAGVGVIDALRTLGGNERREASAKIDRDMRRVAADKTLAWMANVFLGATRNVGRILKKMGFCHAV
jgi:general secretion pathway protein F